MAYRGGMGRRGGGGFGRGAQLPFELFPENEELGKAQYSQSHIQLIKWSSALQKYWNSSPYFYEDRTAKKVQKPDIETYSDRNLQATNKKPPLWHYIKLDTDHVPAELAKAGENKVKNVRWNMELDSSKFDDDFKKIEQKVDGLLKERIMDKKANEDEEENEEKNEDDEDEDGDDFSDGGDYGMAEYCDDDEDDYNDVDDGNDEPFY